MTNSVATNSSKRKACFTPKMDNFKTSLKYEGLVLKKSSEGQTIADLKRKYAR